MLVYHGRDEYSAPNNMKTYRPWWRSLWCIFKPWTHGNNFVTHFKISKLKAETLARSQRWSSTANKKISTSPMNNGEYVDLVTWVDHKMSQGNITAAVCLFGTLSHAHVPQGLLDIDNMGKKQKTPYIPWGPTGRRFLGLTLFNAWVDSLPKSENIATQKHLCEWDACLTSNRAPR